MVGRPFSDSHNWESKKIIAPTELCPQKLLFAPREKSNQTDAARGVVAAGGICLKGMRVVEVSVEGVRSCGRQASEHDHRYATRL